MTIHRAGKVLIIGLGSTLRGDDALGRIVAQRVRLAVDPARVRVIDQCAPTPELAAELAAVSLAVFVDAAAEGPADRPVVRRLSESAGAESWTHRQQPGALLALTRLLYGHAPTAYAILFRGSSFDFGDGRLSPAAEAASELLVRETLRLAGTVCNGSQ